MEDQLAKACEWVDRHLAEFAVHNDFIGATVKAVAELAHAADVLLRSGEARWVATGARWMSFARDQLAGGEVLVRNLAAQPMLMPLSVAFLPFHLNGDRCEGLAETVSPQLKLVSGKFPSIAWTLMVPAFRILGIKFDPSIEAQARSFSVLARRPDPRALSEDEIYVLVHECLYASRWGRRLLVLDASAADYVARALPMLTGRYATFRNADIVAELLLAASTSSMPCANLEAWGVVQNAQTREGNVAPPDTMFTSFPRLRHPTLTRTYHTTLAAIMAWSTRRTRTVQLDRKEQGVHRWQ